MFLYINFQFEIEYLFCFDFWYTGSSGDAYVTGGDAYGDDKTGDAYGTSDGHTKAAEHAKDGNWHFFF